MRNRSCFNLPILSFLRQLFTSKNFFVSILSDKIWIFCYISFLHRIETTAAPVAIDSRLDSNSLRSSLNEDMEYRTSQILFRQLVSNGRNNLFTGGQSVVNFSQFMACLGLSMQDTTTLTATFTETKTISTGFTTFHRCRLYSSRISVHYLPTRNF